MIRSIDEEPPTVPGDITASNITETTVSLSWPNSIDNIQLGGYDVFRNDVSIANVTNNNFTDTSLVPDTAYSYKIRAFDSSQNYSSFSTSFDTRTNANNLPPSKPENISITYKTSTTVTLSWSSSVDNVATIGYDVYRDGTKVGTATNNSFTDYGLIANNSYTYWVEAYDAAGKFSEKSSSILVVPEMPCISRVEPANGITIGGAVSQKMHYTL